jgi:hypothetical protein
MIFASFWSSIGSKDEKCGVDGATHLIRVSDSEYFKVQPTAGLISQIPDFTAYSDVKFSNFCPYIVEKFEKKFSSLEPVKGALLFNTADKSGVAEGYFAAKVSSEKNTVTIHGYSFRKQPFAMDFCSHDGAIDKYILRMEDSKTYFVEKEKSGTMYVAEVSENSTWTVNNRIYSAKMVSDELEVTEAHNKTPELSGTFTMKLCKQQVDQTKEAVKFLKGFVTRKEMDIDGSFWGKVFGNKLLLKSMNMMIVTKGFFVYDTEYRYKINKYSHENEMIELEAIHGESFCLKRIGRMNTVSYGSC